MDVSRWPRWLAPLAVTALLGAAMLAATFGNPRLRTLPPATIDLPTAGPLSSLMPQAEASTTKTPPAPPADPESATALPGWLTIVLGAICLVVVMVLIWLLVRNRLPIRAARRPAQRAEQDIERGTRQTVSAALEEGIAYLDATDTDPRRAVIACWVRLEAAAAEAGTARASSDTSTDLVLRLLAAHRLSGVVLDDLAALYRRARFGAGEVDAGMRERARAALGQLRDELSAGVS